MLYGRLPAQFQALPEAHDEARTDRMILFHANGPMVVLDYAAHNGEAQSRTALLG